MPKALSRFGELWDAAIQVANWASAAVRAAPKWVAVSRCAGLRRCAFHYQQLRGKCREIPMFCHQ